jgi:hypothetical protein
VLCHLTTSGKILFQLRPHIHTEHLRLLLLRCNISHRLGSLPVPIWTDNFYTTVSCRQSCKMSQVVPALSSWFPSSFGRGFLRKVFSCFCPAFLVFSLHPLPDDPLTRLCEMRQGGSGLRRYTFTCYFTREEGKLVPHSQTEGVWEQGACWGKNIWTYENGSTVQCRNYMLRKFILWNKPDI